MTSNSGRVLHDGTCGILPDAKRYSDEVETILLEARRLSRSLRMGEHGRRIAGAGSDFWQFRKFENGLDSPRLINWKHPLNQMDCSCVKRNGARRKLCRSWWIGAR